MTDQIEKFSETVINKGVRLTYQVTTFSHKDSSTKNIKVNGVIETLEDKNNFSADFVVTKESSYKHYLFYKTYVFGTNCFVYVCSCGRPYSDSYDISPENCLARSNRYVREKIGDLCD